MIASCGPLADIAPEFDEIWREAIDRCKVRPAMSIGEFSETNVVLPDGPHKGLRLKVEYQPWVGEVWKELESGTWPEVFFVSPSQCGKTLILFVVPIIWATVERGENVVVALPDVDMMGNKWAVDIKPVLEASSRLADYLPTAGAGSKGGTVKTDVTLANRSVLKVMTPGGHESRRSAFTARFVFVTEANKFTEKTIGDLRGRMGAFSRFSDDGTVTANQSLICEGTVLGKNDMPWIARASDDPEAAPISTESEILCPCPGCREYSLFDREHLVGWQESKTETQAAKNARWRCPKCGHEFAEQERKESVGKCRIVHRGQSVDKDGNKSGDAPEVTRLFIRVNGFVNLFRNTPTLGALEWEAAQLDPESSAYHQKEETLCTKVWAIPYEAPRIDSISVVASDVRKKRQGLLPVGVVPRNSLFVATGVDVGLNRCWYQSIAFCNDHTAHVVKYGCVDSSIATRRADGDQHAYKAVLATLRELFDLLDTGFILEGSGESVVSKYTFVDSGYQPDPVFVACRERGFAAGVIPIIGRGKSSREGRRYSHPSRAGSTVKKIGDGWHLSHVPSRRYYQLTLDADDAKLAYQSGLCAELGAPGALTIYKDAPQNHITLSKHVSAEVLTQVLRDGEIVEEWRKTGQNHLLDCGGYAWIAGRYGGFTIESAPATTAEHRPKGSRSRSSNFALTGGRAWR